MRTIALALAMLLPMPDCSATGLMDGNVLKQTIDPPATECLRVTHALQRGDALTFGGLEPTECNHQLGRLNTRVQFDSKLQLVRASRDIDVGEILPRIAIGMLANARRGEQVTVINRIGSLTVSTPATVLRDSSCSSRVLVDMGNGATVALPRPCNQLSSN